MADPEDASRSVVALFPLVSALNHSCWPQAAVIHNSESKNADVLITQPVVSGEQIFICYRPDLLTKPKELRQLELARKWEFECRCERCVTPRDSDKFLVQGDVSVDEKQLAADFRDVHGLWESNDSLPLSFYKSVDKFLAHPLHVAHWMRIQVRIWALSGYIGILEHYDSLPQLSKTDAVLQKGFLQKAVQLLKDQITAYRAVVPTLDHCKLPLHRTLLKLLAQSGIEESRPELLKLDENAPALEIVYSSYD